MQNDLGKFLLRIGVGALMIWHGIHKVLHGHDFIINQLKENNLPTWLWYGVPIGEIVAPLLLIIGVATRLSGLVIAFTMLMSIFLVRGVNGFVINPDTGGLMAELNLLYLFSALAITFLGPGQIKLYRGKISLLQ